MRLIRCRFLNLLMLCLLVLALLAQTRPVSAGAGIVVTTTSDEFDDNTLCSLREAIYSANNDVSKSTCSAGSGNDDTIRLAVGTYSLTRSPSPKPTIPPSPDLTPDSGDLFIGRGVTIMGMGAGKTIIDASSLGDRIFHLYQVSHPVRIQNLTLGGARLLDSSRVNYRLGGGLYIDGSDVYLYNVVIDGNWVAEAGGGIYNSYGSKLFISRSTITGNKAVNGGGIYNNGMLTIHSSAIMNNEGTSSGGGLDNRPYYTSATLTNVTVGNNKSLPGVGAGDGGAGIFTSWPLNMTNVTITQNNGTGLQVQGGVEVVIQNTLIAAQQNGNPNCGFSGTVEGYETGASGFNMEDSDSCNFRAVGYKINQTVMLSTTPSNQGGPTQVYALLPGSPAIDGGSNDPARCLASDQRWSIRPVDGDQDGTATCDIGAFEYGTYTVRKILLPVMSR